MNTVISDLSMTSSSRKKIFILRCKCSILMNKLDPPGASLPLKMNCELAVVVQRLRRVDQSDERGVSVLPTCANEISKQPICKSQTKNGKSGQNLIFGLLN